MVGNSKVTKCESSFPVAEANDTNQTVQRKNKTKPYVATPLLLTVILLLHSRVIGTCPGTKIVYLRQGFLKS